MSELIRSSYETAVEKALAKWMKYNHECFSEIAFLELDAAMSELSAIHEQTNPMQLLPIFKVRYNITEISLEAVVIAKDKEEIKALLYAHENQPIVIEVITRLGFTDSPEKNSGRIVLTAPQLSM